MFNSLLQFLDYIYKKKCYFCRCSHENALMCSKCYDKIEPLSYGATAIINGKKVYCASYYLKEMQKLIRGIKYHNKKELAKYQAKFMYEYFSKIVNNENFAIVPVPMHKKRYKKRKYNHMDIVAQELAILSGWDIKTDLIFRVKDTKPQYKLNMQERQENLKDAFEVKKENYFGENLLIIDDIFTTGSTLSEMINSLLNAGITKITCLTASKVYSSNVTKIY